MSKIRVLLIEDNRLLREGITALLNEQSDIKAISSAGNNAAFEKARVLKPQVVMLDIGLKGRNSLKIAESIKKTIPRSEVIVMDLLPAHADIADFVKAGISGLIHKDAHVEDLLKTIRLVAKGQKVLPPPHVRSLFSKIVEHALEGGSSVKLAESIKMTKREQDIITLISQGRSHKEITEELEIAVFAVKNHVHHIFEKMALYIRLELAGFANYKSNSQKIADPVLKDKNLIDLKS
jgi:DNA-binding NarL/FixJ family response regulator